MKSFNLGEHCTCPDFRNKEITFQKIGKEIVVSVEPCPEVYRSVDEFNLLDGLVFDYNNPTSKYYGDFSRLLDF
jgi:hypothetical protein